MSAIQSEVWSFEVKIGKNFFGNVFGKIKKYTPTGKIVKNKHHLTIFYTLLKNYLLINYKFTSYRNLNIKIYFSGCMYMLLNYKCVYANKI